MNKAKISLETLRKIKEEKLKPSPRWAFVAKKMALWTGLALTVLAVAVAGAVMIFVIKMSDFDYYDKFGESLPGFFLRSIPYFWLLLAVICISAAFVEFKHTNMGYKYRFNVIVIALLVVSVVLGGMMHFLGVGRDIDRLAFDRLPAFHRMLMNDRAESIWQNPERGLLAGQVIGINGVENLTLVDFDQHTWIIILPPVRPEIQEGVFIKTIGKQLDENTFAAVRIIPWNRNLMPSRPFHAKLTTLINNPLNHATSK